MCQAWPPLGLKMQTVSQEVFSLRAPSTLPRQPRPIRGRRTWTASWQDSRARLSLGSSERRLKLALRSGFRRPSISSESYTWEGRVRSRRGRQQAATTQLPQLGPDFWLGCSPVKQCPSEAHASGRSSLCCCSRLDSFTRVRGAESDGVLGDAPHWLPSWPRCLLARRSRS